MNAQAFTESTSVKTELFIEGTAPMLPLLIPYAHPQSSFFITPSRTISTYPTVLCSGLLPASHFFIKKEINPLHMSKTPSSPRITTILCSVLTTLILLLGLIMANWFTTGLRLFSPPRAHYSKVVGGMGLLYQVGKHDLLFSRIWSLNLVWAVGGWHFIIM